MVCVWELKKEGRDKGKLTMQLTQVIRGKSQCDCLDGWTDRRTDGRMDGQMGGWVEGLMDGRMGGWVEGLMDGRMEGWKD